VAEPVTRTAGQVARLLGIAESTLRAWHRRYGVGPQAPRPGGYRRYTDEDVARLQRMHDLIRGGTLPSDAARQVSAHHGRRPAEQVLPDLLAATGDLDSVRCLALLERALTEYGVIGLWEHLCRPALLAIDAHQEAGADDGPGECVEREHVLSWAIAATLHRATARTATLAATLTATLTRPEVMLACADGEQHTLALEVLAVALAERGVSVRMLGAAVPTASLVHAVTRARPAVVVLWAQQSRTADAAAVTALRGLPCRRVVAGPGWPLRDLHGIEHVESLSAAVALLAGHG
jgi:DNA-binding transcriptional MerR regulator/methylmalonyl-CoA mutase cobalamin-binding subunit